MSHDVILLIAGGAIGLSSSMIGIVVSHFLSLAQLKAKYKLDLQYLKDKKGIEKKQSADEQREMIRETLANPNAAALRRKQIAEILKRGQDVSGTLAAPSGHLACFTSKMGVLLSTGEVKDISQCCVGDCVYTIDKIDKTERAATVIDVIREETDCYAIINGELEVTLSHLVYSRDYFTKTVGELSLGEYIYTKDRTLIQVTAIQLIQERTKVYNLKLDSSQPFVVQNYLVCDYQGKLLGLA